jgi:peptidoglycan/LPS O-acetylase OafA/YrhL
MSAKRVAYLDSVRGIAALFVLLSHTVGAFVWPSAYSPLLRWPFICIPFDGKCAVAMFFVLSGYVLSKPYVMPTPRQIFLPSFYLRRFTRIWLPWFFIFLLSITAKNNLFYGASTQPPTSAWLGQFWHAPLTVKDFFSQCFFSLHDSSRQLLIQDWSLGVELKGSALIPLFIFLSPRKRLPFLILTTGILLAFVGTGHYYICFIIGVLISRYGDHWVSRLQRLNRPSKIGLLLLSLLLYQSYTLSVGLFGETHLAIKYGWVATTLGCGGLLLLILDAQEIQHFLNRKPLVFLGRISYSVYLVQFIIILCLLPQVISLLNYFGVINAPALFVLTILISVAATLGCSVITYQYIEVPAINLGYKLTNKFSNVFRN